MLGRKSLVILSNLSGLMAEKMDEPTLHMQGLIISYIAIAVAKSYSRVICEVLITSPLQDRDQEWHMEWGLGLSH